MTTTTSLTSPTPFRLLRTPRGVAIAASLVVALLATVGLTVSGARTTPERAAGPVGMMTGSGTAGGGYGGGYGGMMRGAGPGAAMMGTGMMGGGYGPMTAMMGGTTAWLPGNGKQVRSLAEARARSGVRRTAGASRR